MFQRRWPDLNQWFYASCSLKRANPRRVGADTTPAPGCRLPGRMPRTARMLSTRRLGRTFRFKVRPKALELAGVN